MVKRRSGFYIRFEFGRVEITVPSEFNRVTCDGQAVIGDLAEVGQRLAQIIFCIGVRHLAPEESCEFVARMGSARSKAGTLLEMKSVMGESARLNCSPPRM